MNIYIKIDMFARTQKYIIQDLNNGIYSEGTFSLAEMKTILKNIVSEQNIDNIYIEGALPKYTFGLLECADLIGKFDDNNSYSKNAHYKGEFYGVNLEINKSTKGE